VGAVCSTRIFQVEQVPPLPAKVIAQRLVSVIDGMALSAVWAFQRLGGTAAIWARTGDDAAGAALRAHLAGEGLDTTGLLTVPAAATSQATVIVDGRGERLVVPFHDPAVDPSPAALPLAQLARADILLADVRWPEGAEAAMRAARALGCPVMLDGEAAAPGVIDRLLPWTTHAVFSDAGLRAHTGLQDIDRALAQLATALAGSGCHHVGASCGAEGYRWTEGDAIRHVAAPRVAVVDTLAAGDVFHGALALALVEGRPVTDAARFACMAASLKCTRFGGRLGCPTRDEVERALRHG
jgi:sulfofructose kinase